MEDMRAGINKAIQNMELSSVIDKNQPPLTERDKQMIEYGYMQCALDVTYDVATGNKSFITSLN